MAKTSRDSFKFMLRLPDELRDRLRSASDSSGRSMTAEIIDRLEGGLDRTTDGALRLWLSDDLQERIEHAAKEQDTDANQLIITTLEREFPARPSPVELLNTFLAEGQNAELTDEEKEEWASIYDSMMENFDAMEKARLRVHSRKRRK